MAPQVQLVTYGTVGTRRVTADASYVSFETERVAVDGGNILESSLMYKTPGLLKSMLSWKFNVSAAIEKFVSELRPDTVDLETVFLELTKDKGVAD